LQRDRRDPQRLAVLPRSTAGVLRCSDQAVSQTLISGGTVVSATGSAPADVVISGETIAAVVAPGQGAIFRPERTIDATGKYVIPGGIDAHTHMEMPFGGTFASDTFETGTRAAAWGGTTTI